MGHMHALVFVARWFSTGTPSLANLSERRKLLANTASLQHGTDEVHRYDMEHAQAQVAVALQIFVSTRRIKCASGEWIVFLNENIQHAHV